MSKPTMRVRTETYKGRKLKVQKNPREWGTLLCSINGQPISTPYGSRPEDMDRQLEQLRRDVDFADEARITRPGAFADYMYQGAPDPTPEEIERATAKAAREAADRAAIFAE